MALASVDYMIVIGLSRMAVIGAVALIVIGPE